MVLFFQISFLVVFFVPTIISSKFHPLSDEFINEINQKQSTWKAGRNFEMKDYELVKIISSGTILGESKNKVEVQRKHYDESRDVPESFDSREEWSECADIIGLIQDQSKCGACWAFAGAEAMSDRICIHSNATKKLLVSAQDILTCTLGCGCHGGTLNGPWVEWDTRGYVTGGLYNNTAQGCKSYFLPPCNDHPNKCTDYIDTPDCVKKCDDTNLDYDTQKTYGKGVPTLVFGEKQLQLEILENGPISVAFSVYSDFVSYQSGIYHHVSGSVLGGHAVKMLGWGVENGTKYWLIANSWNDSWGENGYFRILRGTNECGIEDEGLSSLPDYNRF